MKKPIFAFSLLAFALGITVVFVFFVARADDKASASESHQRLVSESELLSKANAASYEIADYIQSFRPVTDKNRVATFQILSKFSTRALKMAESGITENVSLKGFIDSVLAYKDGH